MMLKIAAISLLFSIGYAKENYKYANAKEAVGNGYKPSAHNQYQYQTTQVTHVHDSPKYESSKYESNKHYETTGDNYHTQHGGEKYEHQAETYENVYPKYEFNYEVHNEKTGDIKSQEEQRDGHNVQGKYSLIDADGFRRTVEYKSEGKTGFKATVLRESLGGKDSQQQEYVKYTSSPIKTYQTDYTGYTTESARDHKYGSVGKYEKDNVTPDKPYFFKYSIGEPEIKYAGSVSDTKHEIAYTTEGSKDKYEHYYDNTSHKSFNKPSVEYVPKKYGY